jgi:hypothetical protein
MEALPARKSLDVWGSLRTALLVVIARPVHLVLIASVEIVVIVGSLVSPWLSFAISFISGEVVSAALAYAVYSHLTSRNMRVFGSYRVALRKFWALLEYLLRYFLTVVPSASPLSAFHLVFARPSAGDLVPKQLSYTMRLPGGEYRGAAVRPTGLGGTSSGSKLYSSS